MEHSFSLLFDTATVLHDRKKKVANNFPERMDYFLKRTLNLFKT